MSSELQMCWPDLGKLDCPVWDSGWSGFHAPNTGPAFLVLGQEDVEGGLWVTLWHAPIIPLPLAILRTFRVHHPRQLFFSYDNLLSHGRLSLRWLNQNLLPLELDHVHIRQEQVLVELHLGTLQI
jgi:hypothetical protein